MSPRLVGSQDLWSLQLSDGQGLRLGLQQDERRVSLQGEGRKLCLINQTSVKEGADPGAKNWIRSGFVCDSFEFYEGVHRILQRI